MKCPICAEETIGEDVRPWGPEFAHTRCVKAYSLGCCDARAELSSELEALKEAISEAKPVAVALRFGADPRICLSTVFDTATEAQEYANRTANGAGLVQLYTLKGIK